MQQSVPHLRGFVVFLMTVIPSQILFGQKFGSTHALSPESW